MTVLLRPPLPLHPPLPVLLLPMPLRNPLVCVCVDFSPSLLLLLILTLPFTAYLSPHPPPLSPSLCVHLPFSPPVNEDHVSQPHIPHCLQHATSAIVVTPCLMVRISYFISCVTESDCSLLVLYHKRLLSYCKLTSHDHRSHPVTWLYLFRLSFIFLPQLGLPVSLLQVPPLSPFPALQPPAGPPGLPGPPASPPAGPPASPPGRPAPPASPPSHPVPLAGPPSPLRPPPREPVPPMPTVGMHTLFLYIPPVYKYWGFEIFLLLLQTGHTGVPPLPPPPTHYRGGTGGGGRAG